MRALGILAIKARVIAKWDLIFESNVIGYRPGRSRQDAIYTICN